MSRRLNEPCRIQKNVDVVSLLSFSLGLNRSNGMDRVGKSELSKSEETPSLDRVGAISLTKESLEMAIGIAIGHC